MSNDSRLVLAQLVRSGLWSSQANLFDYKHIVLDADSAITYLYKHCVTGHLRRHKCLASNKSLASTSQGSRRSARHKQAPTPPPLVDYYASTLVNYREFSQYVELLIDLFSSHNIELLIVYRGKYMEAPLFGLLPAQFKKNIQRASEPLIMLTEYNNYTRDLKFKSANSCSNNSGPNQNQGRSSSLSSNKSGLKQAAPLQAQPPTQPPPPPIEVYLSQLRPSRPNLALNIFKQIVNLKCKTSKIKTHQAYYSPYPIMAKLARDHKCPVLTNDGDFIIMDVRAGFILFEEFFATCLTTTANQTLARNHSSSIGSVSSTTSTASTVSVRGGIKQQKLTKHSPKSPTPSLRETRSLFNQQLASVSGRLKFQYHAQFLRQHPGINSALALQLFPLTAGEFVVSHAKSLLKMKIYDREFEDKDLISPVNDIKARNSIKKYHWAAARLEMVSRYLSTKDPELLLNLIRGEAHRLATTESTFEDDYRELFNYYGVAYDFKTRLKFVLKHMADLKQLAYIEHCLVNRECSIDYLLGLLCCSIGRMSSVCYNKSLQFEDLSTKHSAYSMLDRSKCSLMSLLSDNKVHKSEHSTSMSSKQRDTIAARYTLASLTVFDRQLQQLAERVLPTTTTTTSDGSPGSSKSSNNSTNNSINKMEETIRARMTLAKIAQQIAGGGGGGAEFKQDAAHFIELSFNLKTVNSMARVDALKLSQQISARVMNMIGDKHNRQQLAIVLHLHRYSLEQASNDDQYFKQVYLKLGRYFESGLVDHAIYMNYIQHGGTATTSNSSASSKRSTSPSKQSPSSSSQTSLKQLIDLINKYDLENVASYAFNGPAAEGVVTAASEKKTKTIKMDLVQKSQSGKQSNESKDLGPKQQQQLALKSAHCDNCEIRKQIRHLIELLSSSLEAYCELNALLNYPLPQLNLSTSYNPILIFNLTLHNYELLAGSNNNNTDKLVK